MDSKGSSVVLIAFASEGEHFLATPRNKENSGETDPTATLRHGDGQASTEKISW